MLIHLLVAVLLGITVSVLFLNLGPGVLDTLGRDATLTDRTGVWTLLLSLPRNTLVGTGFESFWLGARLEKIWSVYSWRPNQAHNGYLEIFLNLGWTGVALLAVVIMTGYRTAVAAWQRNLPTGSLGLSYVVVVLVYNFTEAAFFRMMTPAWIFFLVAISRVPERLHAKVRTSPQAQAAWSEEIVERGADAAR
jgi:O-antigen ligase